MHFLEDFSNSLSSASIVLCQRCYCCAKGAIQGYCCAKGAIAVPKVLVKGIAVPKVLLLCQRCYCCAKDAIAVPKVLLLCQRCYCCAKGAIAVPKVLFKDEHVPLSYSVRAAAGLCSDTNHSSLGKDHLVRL